MPNPMLSFQHQMELIDACQVLAYTRVILKGNGSQEENTDKNQSSIIGAAEMIQNATCTWVCLCWSSCFALHKHECMCHHFYSNMYTCTQLNEVTGELLFTCTANEVKAFCNQVNIYHSTQAVLNWLIGPINDPCTWISDHFAAERDTEIRQFLLQRTDCSV